MIRAAVEADMHRLIEVGRKFHDAAGFKFDLDEDALGSFLSGLISSDQGAVLISDHGVIGGVLAPSYSNPSWVMAVELFWWAERDGLALLKAFEDWARSAGASEVRMSSLASLPRADVLLRHKGYAATEISYSKGL